MQEFILCLRDMILVGCSLNVFVMIRFSTTRAILKNEIKQVKIIKIIMFILQHLRT